MSKYSVCLTDLAVHRSVRGLLLVVGSFLCMGGLSAQTLGPTPIAPGSTASVSKEVKTVLGGRQMIAPVAKPLWHELAAAQRDALTPLANSWNGLSATQKRKWIALSKNYHQLAPQEQTLLHARMDDWVSLSPQQRRVARLNFAESKRMSSSEKQQKWDAYQALSPAARHKYSEAAPALAPGAAVAVRPAAAQQRLATMPIAGPNPTVRPKLGAPNQIDPHTLLPQRGETVHRGGTVPIKADGRP